MAHKTYFNWSSGKDSSLALHYLLQDPHFHIDRLLTTVNSHFNRVSMHGLRREVLEEQARSIGIPLDILEVPEMPSMEDYNALMKRKIDELKAADYTHTVFGDIFLEDLKQYREKMLAPYGIEAVFPIWKKDTTKMIREFIDLGFKARIICINNELLDESFLGEVITHDLVDRFPSNVDPCGENGEFHTFCFNGPIFDYPVEHVAGEKVFRTYPNPSAKEHEVRYGFADVELVKVSS